MTARGFIALFFATLLAACTCSAHTGAQNATSPDPYQRTLARLLSLTNQWISDWRSHSDVPHPEDASLNDSAWETVKVIDTSSQPGGVADNAPRWMGTRVFRRSIQIPERIDGYSTEGSRIHLELRFNSEGILLPGNLMVTIFSNGSILYRGADDNLQPVLLTERAHPGQTFLVSARVVGGDQVQSKFVQSVLTIEPPSTRPDPGLLRMEILAARAVVGVYEQGKAEREQQLDAAVKAIDFRPLDQGNQAGFDASLRQAHDKLQVLKPWLQQFSIRAVGNAHIDLAWLWSWTEAVEVVRNTFRSVLDLMREYPDFKFTMSSARAYEWIQEKYPDLFQEIQQRVKEGRWEVIGGMWVEPDLNMPGGESLVRQILVGKRYFQKNFGVDVNIGWNPDSFGYNWQLPQIYKKSGIDYFVTTKLLWAHDFTTFPYKFFWWQSPDGSRLLTYFPRHYGADIDAQSLGQDVSVWMPSIYGQNTNDKPEMMHLYGVGDHGGGPTRTMLDNAAKLTSSDAIFPKFEFSFARDFFADMTAKLPQLQVPTWDGELYYQGHRGTLTTQAETKKRIRRAEESIFDAEESASFASLFGHPYPHSELELSWKNLLFDYFHDVMPGSGVAVNYLEAQRNLEEVGRTTNQVTQDSLREIAAHANTQGDGVPVMIFNSLSWPRTEVFEAEAQLPESAHEIRVVDSAGKLALSQLLYIDAETHRARFLLLAHVPALGYQTYFVRPGTSGTSGSPDGSSLKTSATSLENEFLRLQVDPQTGCMVSLIVKDTGRDALAPAETDTGGPRDRTCGNLLQTFVDKPRLMGVWNLDAWNIDADFEKQHWDLDKADDVSLVESGPLRSIIRVKNHFQNSTFVRDITMYPGVPRVDVKMQTEWHEKHILLKVAFPLSAHNNNATFEIPFGSVERPTTRNTPAEQAQFEVPAQRWADISDSNHGFSLLNDCKYGYDAKGNVLRLSLLRSPNFPDPHADEGHHEFTYSLFPHDQSWREARTTLRGYELNYKLVAFQTLGHQGKLPPEFSFLTAQPDNIIVTAVKKAEDGDALIVRFYEWAGAETDVRLQFPVGAISAAETNLMETPLADLPVRDGTLVLHTKPYEIKTVRVQFAPTPSSQAAPTTGR
jgi:alpha-mannosidase